MLWSILGLLAASALLAGLYFFLFKPFSIGLAERGFNFYGLTGKLIMTVGCVYFAIGSFANGMTAGWGVFAIAADHALPTLMLKTMLLLLPGYVLFFLVCLVKTHDLIRSLIALVFMVVISVAAGYLSSMIVGFVVLFFFLKSSLASIGGNGNASGYVTCSSCGKSVRIDGGRNGPHTCPHCNLTL